MTSNQTEKEQAMWQVQAKSLLIPGVGANMDPVFLAQGLLPWLSKHEELGKKSSSEPDL